MLTLRPPHATNHFSIACVFNLRCLLINNERLLFGRATNTGIRFPNYGCAHLNKTKKKKKGIHGEETPFCTHGYNRFVIQIQI